MNQRSEKKPKHEAQKKPGKDDVHEQREEGQPAEGAVKEGSTKTSSPPNPTKTPL